MVKLFLIDGVTIFQEYIIPCIIPSGYFLEGGLEDEADMSRLQSMLEARGFPPHLAGVLGPRYHHYSCNNYCFSVNQGAINYTLKTFYQKKLTCLNFSVKINF